MKYSSWIYHQIWIQRLKKQQSSPNKMLQEVAAIQSNCRLAILNKIEPYWLAIKKLPYQLDLHTLTRFSATFDQDEFKKRTNSSQPVYTDKQKSQVRRSHYFYIGMLATLVPGETCLYFFTGPLFLPGASNFIFGLLAIFLTLVTMGGFDIGLSSHFKWREACTRHRKQEITDSDLKIFVDERNTGYVISALTFIAVVGFALGRIFYLEGIDSRGLSEDRLQQIENASLFTSIATLFVTVGVAFFLARLKQAFGKNAVHFDQVIRQERTQRHIERDGKTLLTSAAKIEIVAEQFTEKYWQLAIDMKRVFLNDTEFDGQYLSKYQRYVVLKDVPGFQLNEDTYRAHEEIQSAYLSLFRFGVLNDPFTKEKLDFAREVKRIPKEHLEAYLRILDANARQQLGEPASTNGQIINNNL